MIFEESLSARRAWIEIRNSQYSYFLYYVALRKESVDRNINALESYNMIINVALRKESVDRNFQVCTVARGLLQVALRKESVDRNSHAIIILILKSVALRKESVDRNSLLWPSRLRKNLSLSARRAWIEMHVVLLNYKEVL